MELWRDYWAEVQVLENELATQKEAYDVSKSELETEVTKYKKIEKEHSSKVLEYVKEVESKREQKINVDKLVEARKAKVAELELKERDNEAKINELSSVKSAKEQRVLDIQISTKQLNESNNDFLEVEVTTRNEIKDIINSIYAKKNWEREANVPLKSEILNVNKRKQIVYQSKAITKKKDIKFSTNEGGCKCAIF